MKFTNRIIAVLLCLAMMSAFACLSVSAITLFPVGNWVYHKINNETEFEIYEYNGTQTNVFTPYSHNLLYITTVGANSFDSNTTIQKITFSKYMKTIDHHAFLNCTSLSEVVFQDVSVTTINDYAFAGCVNLKSIRLEDTLVDTISTGTFMNCDSLVEFTVPDTVTTIEQNAFGYCDSLEKIVIPATVTTINAGAFSGSDAVVIYCYENSLAHRYAVNNEIEYVLLDAQIETYLLGDSDNDGVISVMDATTTQLYLASKLPDADDKIEIRANVDVDSVLSIMDATAVQLYVAGYVDLNNNIGKSFEY